MAQVREQVSEQAITKSTKYHERIIDVADTRDEMMKMAKPKKILKNKMKMIICNHCHKKITSPALVGLTLVCPHCKKSVNGQYYHEFNDEVQDQ